MNEPRTITRSVAHLDQLMVRVEVMLDELNSLKQEQDRQVFQELLDHYDDLDADDQAELIALSREVGAEFVEELGLKISMPGRHEFRLDDSGTAVYLRLLPPLGDGACITEEQLLAALAGEGVTFGIDRAAVAAAVSRVQETGEPVSDVLIAHGEAPVDGIDGRLELCLPAAADETDDDDDVPGQQRNSLIAVADGQLLARLLPPQPGHDGRNVFGDVLPAAVGHPSPVRAGEHVEFTADTGVFTARCAGRMVLQHDILSVSEVLVVDGDLDLVRGNLDFPGTVVVQGFVRSGLRLRAGRDIEVHGGVEAAVLEAGGSVHIDRGVQGSHRAIISAGGSISAKFIENAAVFARDEVRVQISVIASEVTAGSAVRVSTRKGAIIGGVIRAGQTVTAREIGSTAGVITSIVLGITPEILERLLQYDRERAEAETRREKVESLLGSVQHYIGSFARLPFAKRRQLISLKKALLVCKYRIRSIERDKQQYLERAKPQCNGTVSVHRRLYPNVRIGIGRSRVTVKHEQQSVCLFEDRDAGRIATRPL